MLLYTTRLLNIMLTLKYHSCPTRPYVFVHTHARARLEYQKHTISGMRSDLCAATVEQNALRRERDAVKELVRLCAVLGFAIRSADH